MTTPNGSPETGPGSAAEALDHRHRARCPARGRGGAGFFSWPQVSRSEWLSLLGVEVLLLSAVGIVWHTKDLLDLLPGPVSAPVRARADPETAVLWPLLWALPFGLLGILSMVSLRSAGRADRDRLPAVPEALYLTLPGGLLILLGIMGWAHFLPDDLKLLGHVAKRWPTHVKNLGPPLVHALLFGLPILAGLLLVRAGGRPRGRAFQVTGAACALLAFLALLAALAVAGCGR